MSVFAMHSSKIILLASSFLFLAHSWSQTTMTVNPTIDQNNIGSKFKPGVFYVPKTAEGQDDFLNNGIDQNAIRLNVIESALNNTSNLTDCIAFLDNVSSILLDLSAKTDNLLFIFEKMPVWLSSSSDGSLAAAPGWYVLNTKPPANWLAWQNVVTSITDRLVNNYSIQNAQFEIWNEPGLGSWTGSKAEYFELYQKTYDAIKSVDSNLPVGGPASNHWSKNINYQPPYGYMNNQYGDSSLIGELIDSSVTWGKPLDFISWHNFEITHQTNANAIDYINQKYIGLGLPVPKLIVSEWNTPSQIRDTPLQKAYFMKRQITMADKNIAHDLVAAWQDFEQSPAEFHSEYGLLTWGAIHKPAYKGLLLANRLDDTSVQISNNGNIDAIATVQGDSLKILMVNYIPPAFFEAFNHTLFEGKFNTNQLDSAGYINIQQGSLNPLDSIFKGLITVANNDPVSMAVNSAIPIYQHYDSLQSSIRNIQLSIAGFTNNYSGRHFTIDSTQNNSQYTYDSLINQGFSQANAIIDITADQSLLSNTITATSGQFNFQMQPNAIHLFAFKIPELVSVKSHQSQSTLEVFPNPAQETIRITGEKQLGVLKIIGGDGKLVFETTTTHHTILYDISELAPGIYLIQSNESKPVKFIKQ